VLKHADRFGRLPEEIEGADQSLMRHLQIEEMFQDLVAERAKEAGQ
jgi:hypothetical protein